MEPLEHLQHASVALLIHRGEATVRSRAADVITAYDALVPSDRISFFCFLRDEMGPDATAIEAAIDRYRAERDAHSVAMLAAAAEPVRQDFLRRLNTAPGGTRAIIRMRTHLLELIGADPELSVVDGDFLHLLRSWFNRGFLQLVRLDWSTPAQVLEQLIRYEAVHAIRDWSDLRRRLEDDRRLYAYTHSALPDEPLIFVEVALVNRLVGAIDEVLSQAPGGEGDEPSTAIFYSITNTQPGLAGVSFGNFLIKQVMDELRATVPSLRTFSTLSPLPGFMRWINSQRENGALEWMAAGSAERLPALADTAWIDFPQTREALRPGLLQAAARYLLHAKRPDASPPRPLDPVARFHVRNGASVFRINWLGDTSPKGLAESAGVLVNYLYDPESLTANLEAHARDGTVAASESVEHLARGVTG